MIICYFHSFLIPATEKNTKIKFRNEKVQLPGNIFADVVYFLYIMIFRGAEAYGKEMAAARFPETQPFNRLKAVLATAVVGKRGYPVPDVVTWTCIKKISETAPNNLRWL
jgi:hypothetical protein